MTMEKLNDEELDVVTGGNVEECSDLRTLTGVNGLGAIGDWLKANLNIDCSLHDAPLFDVNNTYSITTNGEKRTLKHEEVLSMIDEYRQQHTGV